MKVAFLIAPISVLLAACSAGKPANSSKVVAPDDMPDICQDLDFNRDDEFHELCGVKGRDYLAYRNIPEHRNLLQPKGGKMIKKGKALELRLPGTLPAPLPPAMSAKIVFDETRRRTFIKSRMDYCEYFPEQASQSVKIIKLDIPQDLGGEVTVCFIVESRPTTAQRKTGYASRLEPLACGDFTRLKAEAIAKASAEEAGAAVEAGQASAAAPAATSDSPKAAEDGPVDTGVPGAAVPEADQGGEPSGSTGDSGK